MARGFGARESGSLGRGDSDKSALRMRVEKESQFDNIINQLQEGMLGDASGENVSDKMVEKVAGFAAEAYIGAYDAAKAKGMSDEDAADEANYRAQDAIDSNLVADIKDGRGFAAGEGKPKPLSMEEAFSRARTSWKEVADSPYPPLKKDYVEMVDHIKSLAEEDMLGGAKLNQAQIQDIARGAAKLQADMKKNKDSKDDIDLAVANYIEDGAAGGSARGFGAGEAKTKGISASSYQKNYNKAVNLFSKTLVGLGYSKAEARREATEHIRSLSTDSQRSLGLIPKQTEGFAAGEAKATSSARGPVSLAFIKGRAKAEGWGGSAKELKEFQSIANKRIKETSKDPNYKLYSKSDLKVNAIEHARGVVEKRISDAREREMSKARAKWEEIAKGKKNN